MKQAPGKPKTITEHPRARSSTREQPAPEDRPGMGEGLEEPAGHVGEKRCCHRRKTKQGPCHIAQPTLNTRDRHQKLVSNQTPNVAQRNARIDLGSQLPRTSFLTNDIRPYVAKRNMRCIPLHKHPIEG